MPPYLRLGSIPRKRHIAHPHDPGFKGEGIYYEEVVTARRVLPGLQHRLSPAAADARGPARAGRDDPGRFRRSAVAAASSPQDAVDAARRATRSRAACRSSATTTSRSRAAGPSSRRKSCSATPTPTRSSSSIPAAARLHTMFGPLPFRDFDYVVIPRCTTYRLEFEPACQPDLLVIEAAGNISIPGKYLNPDGQLKLGAPYSERDLHGPREVAAIDREQETTVLIKDGRRLTRYTLASHPFDVVGWDGMVYPYTFNADDFEPITGTDPPAAAGPADVRGAGVRGLHVRPADARHPPRGDQGAVRPLERAGRRGAVLCPGPVRQPARRRGGVVHAPSARHSRTGRIPARSSPAASVRSTDELAVMVDTFRPLQLTRQAIKLDDPSYPLSWID